MIKRILIVLIMSIRPVLMIISILIVPISVLIELVLYIIKKRKVDLEIALYTGTWVFNLNAKLLSQL